MWSSPVMTPASHAGNPEFESRLVYFSFLPKENFKLPKIKFPDRELNPGLVRGRDVYYHCTTGAEMGGAGRGSRPRTPEELQKKEKIIHMPRFELGISCA